MAYLAIHWRTNGFFNAIIWHMSFYFCDKIEFLRLLSYAPCIKRVLKNLRLIFIGEIIVTNLVCVQEPVQIHVVGVTGPPLRPLFCYILFCEPSSTENHQNGKNKKCYLFCFFSPSESDYFVENSWKFKSVLIYFNFFPPTSKKSLKKARYIKQGIKI
jgi:hypothetical protein